MNYQIIPSILSDNKEEAQTQISLIHTKAKRISIDIIDGLYADNVTLGLEDIPIDNLSAMKVDIQLMVVEPTDYLGQAHMLGAQRVYGHIEKMGDRAEFIEVAQEIGVEPAWALDLYTPIEELTDDELQQVEGILLMSVKAGFSGQDFNPLVLEKISELRDRNFQKDIVIDGGMNSKTIPICLEAGANQFAVTSALWQTDDAVKSFHQLQRLLPNDKN